MTKLHERTRLKGPWDGDRIARFLTDEISPIRLAPTWINEVPLPVSVWFLFEDGVIWCASHAESRLIEALTASPRVGFEVSVNDVPYRGVRGQGRVEQVPDAGHARLGQLIDRYLGDRDSSLAKWLLSRADDEIALRLVPDWILSWDFSERM